MRKLADYAIEVLERAGKSMHITQLVDAMQKAGWVCGGKRPEQVSYASLHDFIKRRGDESPLRLVGKSTFATAAYAQGHNLQGRDLSVSSRPGKACKTSTIPVE